MNLRNPLNATHFLFLLALTGAGNACATNYFPFRVAFENVPGAEEITSGDVSAGIELLEEQLHNGAGDRGYVIATLCGAYVLDSALQKAATVCTEAVETFPSETAFNNRGVLRAFTGDFEGARADFERARPLDMAAYLEQLKSRDVGLVADGNQDILERLAAKHTPADVRTSVAMSGGTRIARIDH